MTTFTTAQGEVSAYEMEALLANLKNEDPTSSLDFESRDPHSGRINTPGNDDTSTEVEFFVEQEKSAMLTLQNGGVPVYVDIEMLRIKPPRSEDGVDRTVTVHVNDYYIKRFPKEYQRFKAGLGGKQVGTSLDVVKGISYEQMRELTHFNITTVEQLMALPDAKARNIAGAFDARLKAQLYLDEIKVNEATASVRNELAKRDAKIDDLTDKLAQLTALLEKQIKKPKSNEKDSAE